MTTHFMQQLSDGDLAVNNGGWQWAASAGIAVAPYFRIFHPATQGDRFDKQGTFIRLWLPALNEVPDSDTHQPHAHAWAKENNKKLDYPLPIVEHKSAHKKTLDAFERAPRRLRCSGSRYEEYRIRTYCESAAEQQRF